MKFENVRRQLDEVYSRAIEAGLAVRQQYPSISERSPMSIGDLGSMSVAFKDVSYGDIYEDLERHGKYHLKFPDGALMHFQYRFDDDGWMIKHRLAYFPCPQLPSADEAPELYAHDELYGDIMLNRLVRFPIRFDYDPSNFQPLFHAHSHLTLGQFDNCRIPASHPLSPYAFLLFVIRNFYFRIYRKKQNIFDRRIVSCASKQCITDAELRITSLQVGKQ